MKNLRKIMSLVLCLALLLSYSGAGLSSNLDEVSTLNTGQGIITGVVTDKDTGAPIKDVCVAIYNGGWYNAYTDEEGRYSRQVPVGNDYSVRVYGSDFDYQDVVMHNVAILEDQVTELDFQLEPLVFGTITGIVTDSKTGEPIEDVEVYVYNWQEGYWHTTYTNEVGIYELNIIADVEYTLWASGDYSTYFSTRIEQVSVAKDEILQLNIQMVERTYGSISGVITDAVSGEPLEGAWISGSSQGGYFYAETDENGFYSGNTAIGLYDLSIVYYGNHYEVHTHETVVEIGDIIVEEGVNTEFNIKLLSRDTASSTVSGKVKASSGEPLYRALVTVFGYNSQHDAHVWDMVYSEMDGSYSLDIPVGIYNLKYDYWNKEAEYVEDITIEEGQYIINFQFGLSSLLAALELAESLVAYPFVEKGTTEDIQKAIEAHDEASALIENMAPGEQKDAFQDRIGSVWDTIEERIDTLSLEAEAALDEVEDIVAEPFSTTGTLEQIQSAYDIYKGYISFIFEFMDQNAQDRLAAVIAMINNRLEELLQEAKQTVETTYNEDNEKYEAAIVFEEASVTIKVSSDESITDATIAALRLNTAPVTTMPEESQSAGIFLELQQEGAMPGASIRIEVSYDPGNLPSGVSETSLKLYRYNPETKEWDLIEEQGVDTENKIIWANVTEFSLFGVFGEGDILFGDVNGDGLVDVGDAILVLRHIVGLVNIENEYGAEAIVRANVNGDGDVDVGDAILILRYIVGLISEFPAEG